MIVANLYEVYPETDDESQYVKFSVLPGKWAFTAEKEKSNNALKATDKSAP